MIILHGGWYRPKNLEFPCLVQYRRIAINAITFGDKSDRFVVGDVGQSGHHERTVGRVLRSPAIVVMLARVTTQDVPPDTNSRKVKIGSFIFTAGIEFHLGSRSVDFEYPRSSTICVVMRIP